MARLILSLLAIGLLGAGGASGAAAAASAAATVRAATVTTDPQGATRIAIALDRPASARHFTLENPHRLVVDVASARVAFRAPPPCGGPVTGIRHGARPDGAARLVFDLAGPARVRTEPAPQGTTRLIFLVEPLEAVAEAAPPSPGLTRRQPQPTPRGGRPLVQRTVVIDAGHGGHDPGALGAAGAREKVVVLAAALRLREELEARGGYRVVLTRDGDVFLPLEDRVRIAREHRADLFISLHADANENRNARGASVYTLSERGGARARGVMEKQDWHVDLGGDDHPPQVQRILLDLAQRETTNRSADFAQTLIAHLGQTSPLLRNTHRNAGFFVLLAPDVPAVLVELGFMTNAQDEERLVDPAERRRKMAAVADAIDVYFERPRTYAAR